MMSQLPKFKRVVTTHNPAGQSHIWTSGMPPVSLPLVAVPGTVFHEIWKTSESPVLVDNGRLDPTEGPLRLAPSVAASAVRVVDIPPDSIQNSISAEEAASAFESIGAGHAGSGQSERHRLMHRTETLDYGIVVAGEVWMILDEDEVCLQVGDIVVQRGTNHAWSNRTEDMARMVFILLDGQYDDELRQALHHA